MPYIPDIFPRRDDYLGPGAGASLLLNIAPIFFGLIFNWFLLGTLMTQVYYYHLSFPKDHRGLKALVYGVFILDLIQTGLSTETSYHTFVQYFANIKVLNDPSRTLVSLPLFDGVIAAVVQAFYAWRIWQLGKALLAKLVLIIIMVVIFLTSALQTIGGMITAFAWVRFQKHPLISVPVSNTGYVIWVASGMAADTIIAFAMSYLISKAKDTKFMLHGNTLLNKILIRVVATGVLTAFCAMVNLIFFVRFEKTTDLYETPSYILGKLFSNALLVNLNARSRNEKGRFVDLNTTHKTEGSSTTGTTSNSITFASPPRRPGRSATSPTSTFPPGTDLSSMDVQAMHQISFPENWPKGTDSTTSASGGGEVHPTKLQGIPSAEPGVVV